MSDELVTVAEFEMVIDAEMAKDYLEDNDIKAVVVGENLTSVMTQIPNLISVEVKVMESDAEKAKTLLEEHRKQCQEAADAEAEGDDVDDDDAGEDA